MENWSAWLADGLVIFGSVIITIGVYGVLRMPDIYTKLHAASKSVFLGVNSFAVASLVTGDQAIVTRVLLIGAVLVLTTPVASHVIGRAAYLEHLPMTTPDSIDESGHHLADAEAVPASFSFAQREPAVKPPGGLEGTPPSIQP
jgi:multicomponent Na+:H+ antiporter subunit G